MQNPRVKVTNPATLMMCRAALKAARRLLRDFGEVEQLQVSQKGPKDFVSNADRQAERTIRQELEKARPDFGFLMEESGEIIGKDKSQRWIIDPLDGTMNFLHGMPYFCISIAHEKDGEIIAGVVYDPVRDEMFCAEKGAGAYVNEHRLRVSARSKLQDALVCTGASPSYRKQLIEDILRNFENEVSALRWTGAAALDLCYLAAGRLDAYCAFGLAPWDMAAGLIIIKEAGGYITNAYGEKLTLDSPTVVASNPYLHESLVHLTSSLIKR